MAVIKLKPTSPGQRGVVKVTRDHLHKGEPYAPLLEPQHQKAGRNNNGHITTRHKGGGHKHHYRVVDFKRNKDAIPAKVERIEYDPNRTAHIALVCYADGERRYIIAPRGLEVGATLLSGSEAPIRAGNTLPIRNIPVGSTIHCIELKPGAGAQIARSAGTSATLLAREGIYAQVRMRSGETLVLSGFDQTSEQGTKAGTGSSWNFMLGGGATRDTTRDVIVVLITPIIKS